MVRNFFSVGALTALSRLTGFIRDMLISAIMGAGVLADAYFIALRLPNTFRTIFGEGAFSSAYIPSYSRVLAQQGAGQARLFASRIFTMLLVSQLVLVGLFYLFTPLFISLIAPGFEADPVKYGYVVEMTRITFPYLAFVTLAIMHTGTLNAHGYFAAGAFASVLLNIFVVGFLGIAFLFPNAGVAASWGVLVSGIAQLALMVGTAWRRGVLEGFAIPRFDADVKWFLRALGPAIIGSAGQQIAILLDSILASWLPTGSVSALNYADRLYQLPLGVIGVAAGTVLLPEMSRCVAKGDDDGAARAQNRSIGLTLALAAPFLAMFLTIPEDIIRAAFQRGAFDAEAAQRSGLVLAAYGLGLAPMVVIRSLVASFQSRGDTRTPMLCFFGGLAVNLTMKFALYKSAGATGLAFATAAGAWVNFALLVALGLSWKWMRPDARLMENIAITLFSCGALALAGPFLLHHISALYPFALLHKEAVMALASVAIIGAYAVIFALCARAFGRSVAAQLR
jgi:putative peptidoglycan lipid II flippase